MQKTEEYFSSILINSSLTTLNELTYIQVSSIQTSSIQYYVKRNSFQLDSQTELTSNVSRLFLTSSIHPSRRNSQRTLAGGNATNKSDKPEKTEELPRLFLDENRSYLYFRSPCSSLRSSQVCCHYEEAPGARLIGYGQVPGFQTTLDAGRSRTRIRIVSGTHVRFSQLLYIRFAINHWLYILRISLIIPLLLSFS